MKTLEVSIINTKVNYEIHIGRKVCDRLYGYMADRHKGRKAFIITDDNVNRLYGASLYKGVTEAGLDCRIASVKPGEKSKSLEVLGRIYEELAAFNLTRGDAVIAFGGGVVGDLAGFAASTYLRGVACIQVPTTLLAQVDSSIGGKTAVNLACGKNLVGSFYQPEVVFIDTSLLDSLPLRNMRDGMAEVIKYGCIRDIGLFEKLQGFSDLQQCSREMEDIIYACCRIKSAVVEADERDSGERLLLNFGHTLGHAVEQYYNYEKYTHGEAVAMGMAEITRLGEASGYTRPGTAEILEKVLEIYGLPDRLPDANKQELVKAMKLDKKFQGSSISIVLLKELGEAYTRRFSGEEMEAFISGVKG